MKLLIQYPTVEILERAFECTPEDVERLQDMNYRQLASFINEKVSAADIPSHEQMTGISLIVDMFESGMGNRPRILQEDIQ